MKQYRQAHCIVTLNESGHCTERLVYPSINAAKRANRLTRHRVLDDKKIPQAADYTVTQVKGG